MSNHRALSGTPALAEWSPFHLQYLTRFLPGAAKEPGAPPAALGHEEDAFVFLELQLRELEGLSTLIPADKETHRYASGKWSVRQLLGHLADTERILSWRSLAAARGDKTNIQPFDEESYVANSGHDEIAAGQLVSEIVAVRKSTLAQLATYGHEAWRRSGTTNGHPVSARAWAFVIGAHAQLHLNTLKTRYLA